MDVTIYNGLHAHLRPAAARLYWQAFGGKLGRVLGPDARALRLFEKVIRGDHCLAALDGSGALVGIAGFKTATGSFAGAGPADLVAGYGRLGGRWRGALLRALSSDIDNDNFLIDGICVAPDRRGQGIGRRLLDALCHEAAQRGYRSVRLDVVQENHRARALYDRLGFVPLRSERLGVLRLVYGFSGSTTMIRALDPDQDPA